MRSFKQLFRRVSSPSVASEEDEEDILDGSESPSSPSLAPDEPLGSLMGTSVFACDLCNRVIGEGEAEVNEDDEEQRTFGRYHCQECLDFDICTPCLRQGKALKQHIATWHTDVPHTLTLPEELLFVSETQSNKEHLNQILFQYSSVPSVAQFLHSAVQQYTGRPAMGWRQHASDPSSVTWLTYEALQQEAEAMARAMQTLLGLTEEERLPGVQMKYVGAAYAAVAPATPTSYQEEILVFSAASSRVPIFEVGCLFAGPSCATVHIHPSLSRESVEATMEITDAPILALGTGTVVSPVEAVRLFSKHCKTERLRETGHLPAVIWLGGDISDAEYDSTSEEVSAACQEAGIRFIVREEMSEMGVARAEEPFRVPPYNPMDILTIIFSSGTTGKPKGIPIPDRSWSITMKGMSSMGSVASHICFSPLSLSGPRQNTFIHLLHGARTFYSASPLHLSEDLLACRPTVLSATPRLWADMYRWHKENMLSMMEKDKAMIEGTASSLANLAVRQRLGGRLRSVNTGGAPISRTVKAWMRECFHDLYVSEGYGATECSAITFSGWVNDDVEVKLTDYGEYKKTDQPPRGLVWVKSERNVTGYYKDEELSRAAFDDEGFYCTGDIGLLTDNNQLRLISRQKELIKLAQGEFVRPAHLEDVFLPLLAPEVAQIYVHADSLFSFLVAIVVPKEVQERSSAGSEEVTEEEEEMADSQREEAEAEILERMRDIGLEKGLRPWEIPVAVTIAAQPFSPVDGTLTDSYKLCRRRIATVHAAAIEEMQARDGFSVAVALVRLVRRAVEVGREEAEKETEVGAISVEAIDSITAVQLSGQLQQELAISFPAVAIAACSSASVFLDCALALAGGELQPLGAVSYVRRKEDKALHDAKVVEEDSYLADDLAERFAGQEKGVISKSKAFTILLTGATGFVGSHLLTELLREYPRAKIYCLVRTQGKETAQERLEAALDYWSCWPGEEEAGRVVAVAGDLSEPMVGMKPRVWKQMEEKLLWMVHAGAMINSVLPYAKHRGSNVLAVRELIGLASRCRKKVHLDFVSSMSVFHGEKKAQAESKALTIADLPSSGYGRSKGVGELLVQRARNLGLSASIFRVGLVCPNRRTRVFNHRDWMAILCRGVAHLGCYPPPDSAGLSAVSVDAVAAAIVCLGGHPCSESMAAYHITGTAMVPMEDVMRALSSYIRVRRGEGLEEVALTQWTRRVARVGSRKEEHKSFVSMFAGGFSSASPLHETRRTRKALGARADLLRTPAARDLFPRLAA